VRVPERSSPMTTIRSRYPLPDQRVVQTRVGQVQMVHEMAHVDPTGLGPIASVLTWLRVMGLPACCPAGLTETSGADTRGTALLNASQHFSTPRLWLLPKCRPGTRPRRTCCERSRTGTGGSTPPAQHAPHQTKPVLGNSGRGCLSPSPYAVILVRFAVFQEDSHAAGSLWAMPSQWSAHSCIIRRLRSSMSVRM
jgi:hypothetical protein